MPTCVQHTVWRMMTVVVAMVWTPLAAAEETTQTARPVVVLQPGILGFKTLSLLGNYWGVVPERLRALGYTVVERAPAPVGSPSVRGRELADDVAAITARYGVDHVVIIAHSQGGVDVRHALAEVPGFADHVGAVATVASPHQGSYMVDVGRALPAPLVDGVLSTIHRAFEANQGPTRHPPDTEGALDGLSTTGAGAWTTTWPTSPVPFFSIGGVTGTDVDHACLGGRWGEPDVEDVVAPTALWNLWSQRLVAGNHSSDGVVPTRNMRFGTFLGCAPADHGDWMGWVSHPLEEELVWSPTPFLVALTKALVDVDHYGARAMDGHVGTLARLARATPTPTPM